MRFQFRPPTHRPSSRHKIAQRRAERCQENADRAALIVHHVKSAGRRSRIFLLDPGSRDRRERREGQSLPDDGHDR
jgi:hypothetical protein